MAQTTEHKLADYFSVIGLDEELKVIDSNQEDKTIEKVEIIVMKDTYTKLQYNNNVEKWLDLDGSNQVFLRVIYGNSRPITDINFYRITYSKGDPYRMSIPASMGIEPVPIKYENSYEEEKQFKKKLKTNKNGDKSQDKWYFYGDFDLTPFLESQGGQKGTNLCFCFSRKKKYLPISDIEIIQGYQGNKGQDDLQFNLPSNLKKVNYKLGKNVKNRLLCYKTRDFLKKKFQAKVIDRYPLPGQDRASYQYPDTLSDFCFPSGIQFTTQRTTPSQFSFILTDAGGQRIYGTALIFDEVLSQELKQQVKQYHVSNIDNIYTQKAICILSHYSFTDSFKEILKQLYRIHLSNTNIPIERYIINIIEEIPVPDKGNLLVLHDIGNQTIPFYRPIDQYAPYSTVNYSLSQFIQKSDIEYLFRALDAEQVIDIFIALLQEKKVLLISKHKALLTHAAVALISFLFPLCWKHVLVPILPKSMIDVLDAPVPFLIGIETYILSEFQVDIPLEVYRVDLDNGSISLRDAKPKLPSREFKKLRQRLIKATEQIVRPDQLLDQVDQAFNTIFVDPEDEQIIINEYDIRDAFLEFMTFLMSDYTKCLIAPDETKYVFSDSRDFFDFKKFRAAKDSTKNITLIYKLTETTLFANFIEARSFGRNDQDEQIMYFDEIAKIKRTKKNPLLVKEFKEKKAIKTLMPSEEGLQKDQTYKYETFPKFNTSNFYQPREIQNYNEDANSLIKTLISNDQLSQMNDAEWARYLNEIIYVLWFQIFCTTLPMFKKYSKELIFFAKRLLQHTQRKLKPMREVEIIYRRLFESCGSCKLQEELLELFNDMKNNKIEPDKVTFGTYYQSFLLSKKTVQEGTHHFIQSNKTGSYLKLKEEEFQKRLQEFELSQQQKQEEEKDSPSKQRSSIISSHLRTDSDMGGDVIETQCESIRHSKVKLSQILENSLYLQIQLECPHCDKPLREEEILTGFDKNLSAYTIKCPICKGSYVPKFFVYSEYKTEFVNGKEGIQLQLLSPITLYKEFVNFVDQKGEQAILKESFIKEHKTVFWNIILYFKILKLPTFLIDLDYSEFHMKVHISQIKKFLPLDSQYKQNYFNSTSKSKLNQDQLKKLNEQSPARRSSITRMASSVVDAIRGSANKLGLGTESEAGDRDKDSVNGKTNNEQMFNIANSEKKSNQGGFFAKKLTGSLRSGSGGGSVVTSLSDLERIEKLMNQAQHANKNIVKQFGKQFEEFRREMQYSKELIMSDITSQGISEAMNKQIKLKMEQNVLTKNFSEWNKNQQFVKAESIMSETQYSGRSQKSNFANINITKVNSNVFQKTSSCQSNGTLNQHPPLYRRRPPSLNRNSNTSENENVSQKYELRKS